jgi:lysylphosphatidylglycerol synthetase-like protein (DUF2156 family)
MKQALIYSLKVWLTAVVVSPPLYLIVEAMVNKHNQTNLEGGVLFVLMSLVYGLLLSIPSYLLLLLAVYFSTRRMESGWVIKMFLTLVGMVLSLIPFQLIFGQDDAITQVVTIPWAVCYCIVVVISLLLYELKPLNNDSANVTV